MLYTIYILYILYIYTIYMYVCMYVCNTIDTLFTLHRIFCDLLRRIPGLMAVDSKLGCAPLMLIFLLQCWFQLPTCFPWKLSDITEAY